MTTKLNLTSKQQETITAFIKADPVQLRRIVENETYLIKRLALYLRRILWYKENPNLLDKDINDTRERIEMCKARIELAKIVRDT